MPLHFQSEEVIRIIIQSLIRTPPSLRFIASLLGQIYTRAGPGARGGGGSVGRSRGGQAGKFTSEYKWSENICACPPSFAVCRIASVALAWLSGERDADDSGAPLQPVRSSSRHEYLNISQIPRIHTTFFALQNHRRLRKCDFFNAPGGEKSCGARDARDKCHGREHKSAVQFPPIHAGKSPRSQRGRANLLQFTQSRQSRLMDVTESTYLCFV